MPFSPDGLGRLRVVVRSVGLALLPWALASCALWPWSEAAVEPAPQPTDSVLTEAPAEAENALPPARIVVDPASVVEVVEKVTPELWAERTLAELALEEKVAQLIMPWVLGDFAPEGSSSSLRMAEYIGMGIGGVIVSVGSPTEVAAKLNYLQESSSLPLLVAADLETGAGFRMRGAVQMPGTIELGGATDFPSLMAVGATGDPALAYDMGKITAIEARAVGVHVPFAPVLDVNNNPDNPIINVRSFGEEPSLVSRLGSAFVRGVQDHGGIATGKHFPGHGDTDVDSHMELPIIRHDQTRMDSVELLPFREAIAQGMGGVMTAHIAVPSLSEGEPDPSTLSGAVLTDLLRGRMGFDGLLFTDAMDMSAISRLHSPEEAAVRAVEAGADVILMPPSPSRAVAGIVTAVEEGRIDDARIDESVRRILLVKATMGLHEERAVAIEEVRETVGVPAHTEVAALVAKRSITLLRNGRNLLPLLGTRSARVMSVSYRQQSSNVLAGRYFNRRLRSTYPRLTAEIVDEDTPESVYAEILARARRQALVIVSTYVTAVSYQGSVALPESMVELIQGLGRIGVPHIVVSFGNPYLIREFPQVQAYMLGWSGSEVSQRAAAAALFGEFEVSGRTPTRIPPLFEVGDGIVLPVREGK